MSTISYYFNNTIRNYTTAIASLFTDIYTQRYDKNGKIINKNRVLLRYWPQIHWFARNYDGKTLDSYGIQVVLPMMSYTLQSIAYDQKRQNSAYEILCPNTELHPDIQSWVYNATPYNLTYDFIVWTEKTAELAQVVEQIIPRFKPVLNLHVKEAPVLDVYRNAKVTFNSQTWDASRTYEIKADRQLQYSFSLTVEGYFYPPIKDQGLIRYITMNLRDYDTEEIFETTTISSS